MAILTLTRTAVSTTVDQATTGLVIPFDSYTLPSDFDRSTINTITATTVGDVNLIGGPADDTADFYISLTTGNGADTIHGRIAASDFETSSWYQTTGLAAAGSYTATDNSANIGVDGEGTIASASEWIPSTLRLAVNHVNNKNMAIDSYTWNVDGWTVEIDYTPRRVLVYT